MNLSQIKSLADQDRYAEAFTACDQLLATSSNSKADVLRTRAYVFAMQGDYDSAIKDREAIFESGEAVIRDYYLAADHALSAGQWVKAENWFGEALRIGAEQGEDWFKGASYFLLAYAQMELDKFDAALNNLDRAVAIESDIAMPTPSSRLCDHATLRQEIEKRQSSRRKEF